MRFYCPACGTAHSMAEEEVPAQGTLVDCSKCGFSITIKAPRKSEPVPPASVAATEQAMPTAEPESAEEQAFFIDDTDPGADVEGFEDEPAPAAPKAAKAERKAAAKAKPMAKPTPKPKAAKPKKPGEVKLPFPGICRSGERYRFRDLFYALRAPLDLRKSLASGAGIFVGSVLLIGITYLATLTKSQIGMTIGLILGSALYFACLYLGLGVATRQTDQEMQTGGRLPMSEGIGFVKSRLITVVGFPFLFVIGIVGMCLGIAIFHLIARIPYAGPIVYGVAFGLVLTLGILAVLIGLLMVFSTFSYIPAAGEHGLLGLARHLWKVLRRSPGWFGLHLLVSSLVAGALMYLLVWVVGSALTVITMVDGLAGGGEFGKILISTPGGLFPMWALMFKSGMGAGMGQGWEFSIAGWLVFIVGIGVISLVQGFVLTYFQAAGAVNYHLLTQDKEA
jgi:predicted Zn finger-like uncharacterized protein